MNTDPLSPERDDLERRLGATLHDHLDPVTASSDLAGPAVSRSRRISRRRTLTTGAAAAAAALVVATPFVWSSLRGPDDNAFLPATSSQTALGSSSHEKAAEPTTSAPTPSVPPTSSAPHGTAGTSTATGPSASGVPTADNDLPPGTTVTITDDAPMGPMPDIAWTFDKTLHRDGRSVALAVGPTWSYAPLAGGKGVVIDTTWEQGGTIRLVAADGTTVKSLVDVPPGQATQIKVDEAGSRFTVLVGVPGVGGSDARIATFDATGSQIAAKSNLRRDVTLAGIVGNRVFLANPSVGRSYVWDLGTNVIERYTDSGLIRAVNGATRRAALVTVDDASTSACVDLLDVTGPAKVLSRTCGRFVPTGFSPDGGHLIGHPLNSDGFAPGSTDVLDVTTGRIVLHLEGASFVDAAFAHDGLIALALSHAYGQGGTTNGLQRCTLQGACTKFADSVPMTNDLVARYRLER